MKEEEKGESNWSKSNQQLSHRPCWQPTLHRCTRNASQSQVPGRWVLGLPYTMCNACLYNA